MQVQAELHHARMRRLPRTRTAAHSRRSCRRLLNLRWVSRQVGHPRASSTCLKIKGSVLCMAGMEEMGHACKAHLQ